MDLYEIFARGGGGSIQGGSTERIAKELAMMQQQREAEEQARAQRFEANAQRRLQQNALSDPALVRLRAEVERPVESFEPERPESYAPDAANDIGDLRGAFSSPEQGGEGVSRPPRGPRVDVSLGNLQLTPTSGGAFSAPQVAADVGEPAQNAAPAKRTPLPAKPRRMEGGISTEPRRVRLQPERRPDLSPEGAEMYAKLLPQLVSRRNTEEVSRRAGETEQMRGDTRRRTEQLRSATSLLRTAMTAAAQAERWRAMRRGAKSKDEALKWADQERDARLQQVKAANALVQQYKYALTDEADPEYQEAVRAASEAARSYAQAETDFNALRTERGMNPKTKSLKKSGTQSYTLDANGQLVPG